MMAGIERMHFFEEKSQWLAEKDTRQYSKKIISETLDIEKLMANSGFYQR